MKKSFYAFFSALFLAFVLSSTYPTARANDKIKIKAFETKENILKLLRFKVKNLINDDLFCRKISIPEVNYLKGREIFESLPANISNQIIDKKESIEETQNISRHLKDLFKFNHSLRLQYNPQLFSIDCEKKESRMNYLYVVDNRKKCGGGIEVRSFNIDYGNELFIQESKGPHIEFTKDTYIIKNNFSNDYLKMTKNSIYLMTLDDNNKESLELISKIQNDKDRKFLGSLWVDKKTFLFYFFNRDHIEIHFYIIKSKSGHNISRYKLSSTISLSTPELTQFIKENRGHQEIETRQNFNRNFIKFLNTFTIFQTYNRERKLLLLAINYRIPDSIMLFKNYNIQQGKYENPYRVFLSFMGTLNKVFKAYEVSLDQHIEIATNSLSLVGYQEMIKQNMMIQARPSLRELKYKSLAIKAHSNTLTYSFGKQIQKKSNFCHIHQIFSDKLMARENKDIDSLYMGKTMLLKTAYGQSKKDYLKAVELLAQKAKVNITDVFKNTPLHLSVGRFNNKFLKLFLANNADPNMQNKKGETPLHREIQQRFSNRRAFNQLDKGTKDEIFKRAKENIQLLLKYNANRSLVNKKGQTPFDLAKSFKLPSIILNILEEKK